MSRSRVGTVPLRVALLNGLGVLGVLAVLVLAGCGGNGGYGGYGGSSSSGGSSASGPAQVKTATATVKGQSTIILTNSQGRTLYYRTTDTASASTCTDGCASTWPPLLTSGSPVAASSLPGTLNSLSDANGTQVTYNGHLLYTYSGDSKPGDTNGEGIGGVWFVATPDLATQGSGGAALTPTSGY
jgi:predicted lipoprotein with Yx(FWY)xxD motif